MGRVSKEQALQNREKIIAIACGLFRQHGVENVSISDIMQAAQLTNGGFYKQFSSKDELVVEAFELAFKQSSDTWRKIQNEHSSARNGMFSIAQHYFKPKRNEQNCPMLILSSIVSNFPSDQKITESYTSGVHQLFQQFLDEQKRAFPEVSAAESKQKAMLAFTAMLGTGLLTRAMSDDPWVKELQTEILKALSNL